MMRSQMPRIFFVYFCLSFFLQSHAAADLFSRAPADAKALGQFSLLAIQSGGRVKPFDTFAREAIELLTGKETFEKRSSLELILSMVAEPQFWEKKRFLQLTHQPLKKDLGLEEGRNLFSPAEISHSQRLMPLFQELEAKQKAQEKLNPYFQAVQRLGNQLVFLNELVSGKNLRFLPPSPEQYNKSDAWLGLHELSEEYKIRFTLIAATFVSEDPVVKDRFPTHVENFATLARQANPALYPSDFILKKEKRFNEIRPFRWAWILALVASILLGFAIYNSAAWLYWSGMAFFGLSFLLQTYGFVVRSWIAGRPPVSNMYESILWVAFGCMFFGFIFEMLYRKRIIAVGALVFSTLALIVSDNISGILDDGIHPLEPVLRSNLWLTVHVLTITLGYAAFALSLVLGNIGLGQIAFFGKESERLPLKTLAFYAYRSVQIGVILLAAGTILGGVWADYSWGRFWGWDPKETWALIALLGYLALLHARFRGMVRAFGFLAGCVVAFLGVLMAWYGVNFVLGAGLHSYGFSSGGVGAVSTYTFVQLLFVAYAIWMQKSLKRS